AVDAGGVITMSLCKIGKITADYNFYGRLVPLICQNDGIVEDTEFAENVTVTFRVPGEKYEKLNAVIFDASNGRYSSQVVEERYAQVN
ncbi:MAG: DUF1949 domain-containing protein, partial [Ruminococcus sp.]|nr:DUF1949 domain-containing protein [Ruminococcus sp.]